MLDGEIIIITREAAPCPLNSIAFFICSEWIISQYFLGELRGVSSSPLSYMVMGGGVICMSLRHQSYGFYTVRVVNLVWSMNQCSYQKYDHWDVHRSRAE